MSDRTVSGNSPLPPALEEQCVPLLETDRTEIEQLYEAFRKGKARLAGPNGEARLLPDSLYSFLLELIGLLNEGKSVMIVQNQGKLSTIEAASILGVSRQFLVKVLEQGEIPYHMVGTHRRIYAQDLFRYRAQRDAGRHELIRDLAQAEVRDGLYDRSPDSADED
jgi:excisionase family DNA binding protein